MIKHLPEWSDEERAQIAFSRLLDDMAELPLIPENEINKIVDQGHFTWNTIRKPWRLSKTQEEILLLLSQGKMPTSIGEQRGITTRTVATHLGRIRTRLRVRTNEEAVAVAIGSGIIPAIERDPELGDRINVRGIDDKHKKVLKLLATGETNDGIAQLLGLSTDTVKDRIEGLCLLMGARNRTHAVSLAFMTGRLTLNESVHSALISEPSHFSLNEDPEEGDKEMRERGLSFPSKFGLDDGFVSVIQPIRGYLSVWKAKNYKFSHVNHKEAKKRLALIENLQEELDLVRADLEKRAMKLTYSAPSERKRQDAA